MKLTSKQKTHHFKRPILAKTPAPLMGGKKTIEVHTFLPCEECEDVRDRTLLFFCNGLSQLSSVFTAHAFIVT